MVKKEQNSQKDPFKEFMEKVWPKTKKELEKVAENAKKMLNKGEEYLKEVSDKSIAQAKRMSLSLKKEKLFYDLGKAAANVNVDTLKTNKKFNALLKEIKSIESQIKKIK